MTRASLFGFTGAALGVYEVPGEPGVIIFGDRVFAALMDEHMGPYRFSDGSAIFIESPSFIIGPAQIAAHRTVNLGHGVTLRRLEEP